MIRFHVFLFVIAACHLVSFWQVSALPLESQVSTIDKYTTRYDNFDVKGVLSSARLVKRYGDCLMDRGPCTAEGKFLKEIIPDAINTACSKCSPIQKKQAGLVLQHLLLNYRDLFHELTDKYDPEGKARDMYGIDTDEEDYNDLDEA